jgi:Putative adhesin
MYEQQFTTPEPVTLEVKVASGEIHVVTVDGDESTVTLEGADKLLEAMHVELTGSRLVIMPRRTSVFGWLGRFEDTLRVHARIPHGSSVEIAAAASDATLDGSFGALEMKSASGDLVVDGTIDGDVQIKSVSGDTRLPRVGGDLRVQTVSGDLTAEGVEGSVRVKSVSGDARIHSVREGEVTVRSVSGDVEIGIAPGTSVDVDAGSASGDLSSEMPLSAGPSGEPGPTVVIRSHTVSGDFRIVRAA